jgi:hypothetical protein
MDRKIFNELKKNATTTRYTGLGEIDELDVDKFAELIVKECLSVVNQSILGTGDMADCALGSTMGDIKKHFGV